MPNPHGRTPGTKNRSGHSAGGARKGAGRKKQLTDQEKKDKKFLDAEKALKKAMDDAAKKKEQDRARTQSEEARQANLAKRHAECVAKLRSLCLSADSNGKCDEEGEDDGVNAGDEVEDYMCPDADVENMTDPIAKARRKYQRAAFVPPPNSTLWKAMDRMKKQVKDRSNLQNVTKARCMWRKEYQEDPVAAFKGSPNIFYESNFHCFVWEPFHQFRNVVNIK